MQTAANGNIEGAISRFKHPLLIGKIDSWDQLFEADCYKATDSIFAEREYFPMITEVSGMAWWDKAKNSVLHVKPTPALLSLVRRAVGYKTPTHPLTITGWGREQFTKADSISGFRIIEWSAYGVALVMVSRTDHNDWGTYIGFIDITLVPKLKPAAEVAPDHRSGTSMIPNRPGGPGEDLRPY